MGGAEAKMFVMFKTQKASILMAINIKSTVPFTFCHMIHRHRRFIEGRII